MRRSLIAVVALTVSNASASDLRIVQDRIGISKMIPKAGDEITFAVPIQNAGEGAFQGGCAIRWTVRRRGGDSVAMPRAAAQLTIAPGEAADVQVSWRPTANGWHQIDFTIESATKGTVSITVPVVTRDLYFAWFGAPLQFRWCNVPCAVKKGDEGPWLRRGAYPCHWRGALCYKQWPLERLVKSWSSYRWIAIDEMAGMSEHTEKFVKALKEVKKAHPDHFIAVWFIGAGHPYWADLADVVDLFMPERYLNYLGNHLGILDPSPRIARETGVMHKMIPGLGVNVRKDKKTGKILAAPTRDDVLRQVRYLKRIAPDLPGLAFFSVRTAPGVGEYADGLCKDYFIDPVITFVDERPRIAKAGDKLQIEATVMNVGGMDADSVSARLVFGDETQMLPTVKALAAGGRQELSVAVSPGPGVHVASLEVVESPDYTILDGSVSEVVMGTPPPPLAGASRVVHLPPTDIPRRDLPLTLPLKGDKKPVRVIEIGPDAGSRQELTSTVIEDLDGRPCVTWVAAGETKPGERRVFALEGAESPSAPAWQGATRERDTLRVVNDFYTAELDLTTDAITTLTPIGSQTNILRQPWRLACPGRDGFGPAQIERLPGVAVVTIPFDSEQVSGVSRYIFYRNSPFIEVSRSVTPKGEWTMKHAADCCGLSQWGGCFALQRGVGALVQRGSLQDGKKYRDLLFGYLAGRPSPENAKKAGWLDFSFAAERNAGLGVAIAERWRDAKSKVYDVTRLYDASDWIEVMYVWGIEHTITRPQRSRFFLVPHPFVAVDDPAIAPSAQQMCETLHNPVRGVVR